MKWELHPVGRFDRDADRWDALQRVAGAMPFHESAFLRPLLDEFGSGREIVKPGISRRKRLGNSRSRRLFPALRRHFREVVRGQFLKRLALA